MRVSMDILTFLFILFAVAVIGAGAGAVLVRSWIDKED